MLTDGILDGQRGWDPRNTLLPIAVLPVGALPVAKIKYGLQHTSATRAVYFISGNDTQQSA